MSFGAYASNQSDWNFRKWLVPMLILSLLLHLGLMIVFQTKRLENFTAVEKERLIPRPFNIKRADIDPRILQDDKAAKPIAEVVKPSPDITKLSVPSAKKGFESALNEIRAAPASPDLSKPLINEKPKVDPASVNSSMSQMEQRSSHALEREMDDLRNELTAQKPSSINQPALTAAGLTDSSSETPAIDVSAKLKGSSAGPEVGDGGFSDLDDLLSQTGPLPSNTKPLKFASETLFAYDTFNLNDNAISSMTKLGQLLQKNPEATFVIEGYTDSFGSPEYNQQLSLARAESVKSWLIQNMSIDPTRIQTQGFGSSKLLVPATKSVEEQQLNRRVEIVIHTK